MNEDEGHGRLWHRTADGARWSTTRRALLGRASLGALLLGASVSTEVATRLSAGQESSAVPWTETFDLPDGATDDDGETAWQVESAGTHPSVSVRSRSLTAAETDGEARWLSEPIDVSSVGAVDVTVVVRGSGSLDAGRDPPALGGGDPPTDPDDDGHFEDVDGDGSVRLADALALFDALETDAVAENVAAFDSNCNGRLDYDDIVDLAAVVEGRAGATSQEDCARPGDRLEVSYLLDGAETVVAEFAEEVAPAGESVEATGLSGETLQLAVTVRTVDPAGAYHVDRATVETAGTESNWMRTEDGVSVRAPGPIGDRQRLTIAASDGGFGEKPGGGPPVLWDFGDEVYVNGAPNDFNAGLQDGGKIEGSPLYGTESGYVRLPRYQRSGEHLRHPNSRGHYWGPNASYPGGKWDHQNGAYFYGIAATGGKTSEPAPFRDDRYYYSFRVKYSSRDRDGGGSLKTWRSSQQDSQSDGYYGSSAGRINKHAYKVKEDGEFVWPPEYEPVWSEEPDGAYDDWHLEEHYIDPTGTVVDGRVWNTIYYYFADTGRQEYPPAVQPTGERHVPTEYWDDSRGYYHQVGPEPSAGDPLLEYWFGEIYVDDSFKRVCIGDSDVWEECDTIELQRITSWTDDEIEIVLNRGGFDSLDGTYLYRIDNDNEAHLIGEFRLGDGG